MTVQEMIYLIRHRIGDQNKSMGIPSLIYFKVLNDALDYVLEDNGGLYQEYTTTSADGVFEYTLPTYTKDIEMVYYDGELLEHIDHWKFYHEESIDPEDWDEGDPTHYYTRFIRGVGKALFLYPVPNTTGDTIRIGIKMKYADLTESNYSDSITLPSYMQDAIADYATYLMFKELQNWKAAEIWRAEAREHSIKSRPTQKVHRKGLKLK